jgi:hypothetical protein
MKLDDLKIMFSKMSDFILKLITNSINVILNGHIMTQEETGLDSMVMVFV